MLARFEVGSMSVRLLLLDGWLHLCDIHEHDKSAIRHSVRLSIHGSPDAKRRRPAGCIHPVLIGVCQWAAREREQGFHRGVRSFAGMPHTSVHEGSYLGHMVV